MNSAMWEKDVETRLRKFTQERPEFVLIDQLSPKGGGVVRLRFPSLNDTKTFRNWYGVDDFLFQNGRGGDGSL